MRRYESVVILDPEMAEDDVRNFTDRYTQLVNTNGGEIIKIEDWGLKRLAYLVKKKERGRYILFDYVGVPALISEIERQFKIAEEVLKFLSVKLDHEVDLEAFKQPPKEAAPAEAVEPESGEFEALAEQPEAAVVAPAAAEEAPAETPAEAPAPEVAESAPATEEPAKTESAEPTAQAASDESPATEPTGKEGEQA